MADGSDRFGVLTTARPTLRFNGEERPGVERDMLSLSVREDEGGLRALEFALSNWGATASGAVSFLYDDDAILRFGADVEVYLGSVERPREVFRGCISAIEGVFAEGAVPSLRISAEDGLQPARLARRSQVYEDITPAELVRAVAQELGLTPILTALGTPTLSWAQIDETDLAFLRRVLARFDADVQVVGRELHVSPRKDVNRGRIELVQGQTLHSVSIAADLAHQVTTVRARGWDSVAGSAVLGEAVALTNAGPGRGHDGASLLRDAFGARSENLGHLAVHTQEEAQTLAEAAFDRRARRLVCARGVAQGNPSLRVGATAVLVGCGARFDNEYYVVSTHHRYDLVRGYRTEFVAECAYLGGNG